VSIPNVPAAFAHQTSANNSFHNIPQPHFACIFANRNCDAEPEFTSVISCKYIYIYISSEHFINPRFDGFETDQMTDPKVLFAAPRCQLLPFAASVGKYSQLKHQQTNP